MKSMRRPIPQGVNGLGSWLYILKIINIISIFSNSALMAYTSIHFEKKNRNDMFLTFVVGLGITVIITYYCL